MRRGVGMLLLLLAPAVSRAATPGAYLGELAWPDAEARLKQAPVVVLPFAPGAKEHGPQLPLNADAMVMEYLCQRAVEAEPVVVAPPILHGWFPAFRQFPGTEVSDATVFIKYVEAVAQALVRGGARRIVFLNTSISLGLLTTQWLKALEGFSQTPLAASHSPQKGRP